MKADTVCSNTQKHLTNDHKLTRPVSSFQGTHKQSNNFAKSSLTDSFVALLVSGLIVLSLTLYLKHFKFYGFLVEKEGKSIQTIAQKDIYEYRHTQTYASL